VPQAVEFGELAEAILRYHSNMLIAEQLMSVL